jgi:hypothetical protein
MPALMAWALIAVCAPRLLISVMIVYNLSNPPLGSEAVHVIMPPARHCQYNGSEGGDLSRKLDKAKP